MTQLPRGLSAPKKGLSFRRIYRLQVARGDPTTLPIHDLAALGTATCRAMTGLISADAVRALGAFHFNLLRQGLVTVVVLLGKRGTGAAGLVGLGRTCCVRDHRHPFG